MAIGGASQKSLPFVFLQQNSKILPKIANEILINVKKYGQNVVSI